MTKIERARNLIFEALELLDQIHKPEDKVKDSVYKLNSIWIDLEE